MGQGCGQVRDSGQRVGEVGGETRGGRAQAGVTAGASGWWAGLTATVMSLNSGQPEQWGGGSMTPPHPLTCRHRQ